MPPATAAGAEPSPGDRLLARLCRAPVPSALSISPDANLVVFALARPGRGLGADEHSLWLFDRRERGTRQLTDGPGDTAPCLSPDGTRLAFLRRTGDAPQLWTLPVTGGAATQLTDRPLGAGVPQWSPDGERIAFTAVVDLATADGLPSSDAAPIVITRPGYRADGIGLRGRRRRHLFVVSVRTGAIEQLTGGDWNVSAPSWSPDGTRISVIGVADPRGDTPLAAASYLLDYPPDDPARPRRVGTESMVWTQAWAPDGSALIVGRLGPRSQTEPRLLRVPVDTDGSAEPVDLLAGLGRGTNLLRPAALPGGGLLVGVNDEGTDRLYRVLGGDRACEPVATPDGCKISEFVTARASMHAALVLRTPTSYGEVALLDLRTGGLEVLTDWTGSTLAGARLVRPRQRRFRISDGTTVTGWLLRRADVAGPAPLLLDVHGGPHDNWGPALDAGHPYQQALAAAGWTVLLLNPRGSDGFGDRFHAAAYGRQGIADERDLLEPLDELRRAGLADPSALFVTGYSYGGYMTCWLTSRTRIFRAAVAGGLHCDLASLAGTSDVGTAMMDLIYGGVPWREPETVAAQSPFSHVREVRTPTLILHGAADERNPPGQAELWFNALHDLGVECELVLYPGADHDFLWSGSRGHRLDYARRTIRWLTER